MKIIPLRKMQDGQSGTITTIKASGALGRRIRDMGLIPGAGITVSLRAPLRDPVAVKVQSATIALRNNEADYIFVTL